MNGIYVLLGSNLGDREKNLRKALHLLESEIQIEALSSVYETEPWGVVEQPWFLNVVLKIKTRKKPIDLLQTCLAVEKTMGRQRNQKWGERLIDIDILYFRDIIMDSLKLKIPHPEIQNRKFTLLPLTEIAGHEKHPSSGLTQLQLLEKCKDTLICQRTTIKL